MNDWCRPEPFGLAPNRQSDIPNGLYVFVPVSAASHCNHRDLEPYIEI